MAAEEQKLKNDLAKKALAAIQRVQADVDMRELQSAFYKLPVVPKDVERGPRGGYFYTNARGERIYLKQRQMTLFNQGKLKGCVGQECAVVRTDAAAAVVDEIKSPASTRATEATSAPQLGTQRPRIRLGPLRRQGRR